MLKSSRCAPLDGTLYLLIEYFIDLPIGLQIGLVSFHVPFGRHLIELDPGLEANQNMVKMKVAKKGLITKYETLELNFSQKEKRAMII